MWLSVGKYCVCILLVLRDISRFREQFLLFNSSEWTILSTRTNSYFDTAYQAHHSYLKRRRRETIFHFYRTTDRLSLLHLLLSNSWIASFTLISWLRIASHLSHHQHWLTVWHRKLFLINMTTTEHIQCWCWRRETSNREGHLSSRWSFCHASSTVTQPPSQKARALTSPKKWLHYVAHGSSR